MINLIVQKTIRATPERLFAAWTDPEQLRRWWGPREVECVGAEVDLRVGGRFRIGNRFPDGQVLWIAGEFEQIERPSMLVYTWRLEPQTASERVTVRFERRRDATEVIIVHERIADAAARDGHDQGWRGCLDGLAEFVGSEPEQARPDRPN